jgi:hypothetical protein
MKTRNVRCGVVSSARASHRIAAFRGFMLIFAQTALAQPEGQIKFDGPLFDIPGGTVKAAAGIDAREEGFDGTTSTGTEGLTGFPAPGPTSSGPYFAPKIGINWSVADGYWGGMCARVRIRFGEGAV